MRSCGFDNLTFGCYLEWNTSYSGAFFQLNREKDDLNVFLGPLGITFSRVRGRTRDAIQGHRQSSEAGVASGGIS